MPAQREEEGALRHRHYIKAVQAATASVNAFTPHSCGFRWLKPWGYIEPAAHCHHRNAHLSPGFLQKWAYTYVHGITTRSKTIAIKKPCVRSVERPAARSGR